MHFQRKFTPPTTLYAKPLSTSSKSRSLPVGSTNKFLPRSYNQAPRHSCIRRRVWAVFRISLLTEPAGVYWLVRAILQQQRRPMDNQIRMSRQALPKLSYSSPAMGPAGSITEVWVRCLMGPQKLTLEMSRIWFSSIKFLHQIHTSRCRWLTRRKVRKHT